MAIITISREMGTGAYQIAKDVAKKLKYTLVDGNKIAENTSPPTCSANSRSAMSITAKRAVVPANEPVPARSFAPKASVRVKATSVAEIGAVVKIGTLYLQAIEGLFSGSADRVDSFLSRRIPRACRISLARTCSSSSSRALRSSRSSKT